MPSKQKRDYIICVQGFLKSNGSRVLHNLAKLLENKGYNVFLYYFSFDKERPDFKYIYDLKKINLDNTVVIYPEIYFGNPLNLKYVVRYVLYYPSKNGGDSIYHPAELIFTHSRKFTEKGDVLTLPYIDTNIFYKDNSKKDKICYFVNKSGKWKDIPELKNAIEINMTFPSKREDLAKLLRETKTLYSYDDCSDLLDEALFCGCEVKIIRENGFEEYKPIYEEMISDYEKQLDNFISKTQTFEPKTREPQPEYTFHFNIIWILKFLIFKYIYKNYRLSNLFLWKIRGVIK